MNGVSLDYVVLDEYDGFPTRPPRNELQKLIPSWWNGCRFIYRIDPFRPSRRTFHAAAQAVFWAALRRTSGNCRLIPSARRGGKTNLWMKIMGYEPVVTGPILTPAGQAAILRACASVAL